jgi:hypothetical protein
LYKFEADAALAYDMGYKLLLKHPQDDVASAAAASRNFAQKESYETCIREELKNANRKIINVEKCYSKVSGSVGVYVSKIFAAEENKLRESLDNAKSVDDDANADFEYATTNNDNVDTSTEFEFTISAPSLSNEDTSVPTSTSQRKTMTKNKKPRDSSLDDFQSGDNDVDGLEHASNNNDDGFNASTEFEDFEFTISTPATIMETAVVETNIEHDDGTIARLRVEENSVPSPQCRTISKKHDYYSVEYDQVCKHFIAYIVLPKTEKRQAEVKYSLGKTDFVFA